MISHGEHASYYASWLRNDTGSETQVLAQLGLSNPIVEQDPAVTDPKVESTKDDMGLLMHGTPPSPTLGAAGVTLGDAGMPCDPTSGDNERSSRQVRQLVWKQWNYLAFQIETMMEYQHKPRPTLLAFESTAWRPAFHLVAQFRRQPL